MLFEDKATATATKDCMYNEVWGYIEILHFRLSTEFTPCTLHQYAYSPFCSQPFSKVADRKNLSHNQKLL